jgi:hypothetical protein
MSCSTRAAPLAKPKHTLASLSKALSPHTRASSWNFSCASAASQTAPRALRIRPKVHHPLASAVSVCISSSVNASSSCIFCWSLETLNRASSLISRSRDRESVLPCRSAPSGASIARKSFSAPTASPDSHRASAYVEIKKKVSVSYGHSVGGMWWVGNTYPRHARHALPPFVPDDLARP